MIKKAVRMCRRGLAKMKLLIFQEQLAVRKPEIAHSFWYFACIQLV